MADKPRPPLGLFDGPVPAAKARPAPPENAPDRGPAAQPADAPDGGPTARSGEHNDALPAGYRLKEFEIVRVLGQGGFAITYLAMDRQLDQQVAIKEYFPEQFASRRGGVEVGPTSSGRKGFEWGYRSFLEEAKTLSRFNHRNVVRSHHYFPANGTAYLVLDYVEGEPLADILASRGPLSLDEWRPWLDQLLYGLEHVHSCNYLHRDITSRNILIRASDDQPVLIDFGSARIATGELTHTVVLTEAYAPMEQHSANAKQGPFTDIYSLGVVTYRALTDDLPPPAPDRAIEDDYVPLAQRMDEARQWMKAVDRALAVMPKDRPRTAAAWRRNLIEAAGRVWLGGAWLSTINSERLTPAGRKEASQLAQKPVEGKNGWIPLCRAAAAEPLPAVLGWLLNHSGSIQQHANGLSAPLRYAAALNQNPAALKLLLDRGAGVHSQKVKIKGLFEVALQYNRTPAVLGFLLDCGADLHVRDITDATPLHYAARWNTNPAALATLLERGADIHARTSEGSTPLHQAAWKNQEPAVLALLLDRGADIHARASDGRTPLHFAARENQNPAVLALLLDRGADLHARTDDGQTALSIADRDNRNPDVVKFLRDRTAGRR